MQDRSITTYPMRGPRAEQAGKCRGFDAIRLSCACIGIGGVGRDDACKGGFLVTKRSLESTVSMTDQPSSSGYPAV